MADGPRIDVVDDLATLDAHADAWDALAQTVPPMRPTLSHAWVRAFLAHRLPQGASWACAFGWQGDRLVGVLPLFRDGAHLHNLCDDHTPSGDAVLASDADGALLDALLHAHGRFRSARFEQVVPESPTHAWLQARPAGRHVLHKPAVMTGARIDVTRPFETILTALSGNARSKLRKGERLLTDSGALDFVVREDAAPFEDFVELEAAGWKGQQGTALRQDQTLRAFYEDLIARLAARGWLRFHVLLLDGQPIAIELAVRFGTTLVVHKVAYDESRAKASPGNVVWARTLEQACGDEAVMSVDLLTMDQLMARWGADGYPYDTFTVFARGLTPTLLTRWPAQWRARLGRLRGGPASE